ncbi:hypothetical protein PAT3040_04128 [Paenibacillus agaridevorans]|uniref:Uncharacterized protein n=1 Tax=Paenibacillus agaridevorans TaxID=171404 RepID=A0A2R5ES14_9BACL|nr:hypothetical protein [Paenibacillus agaridevorans]GBG09482.1 hypothetical protein PAT3040_04128 [Paenibacillus agaridevorans]
MKEKMTVMNRWMDEAIAEGGDAVQEHLQAVARIIGGQVAQLSEPADMPKLLTTTIEEMGKGVTAGMLMQHGHAGILDVRMFSVGRK